MSVYRAYFGDQVTEEDLAFDAGLKIESMFVQIERNHQIEMSRRFQ